MNRLLAVVLLSTACATTPIGGAPAPGAAPTGAPQPVASEPAREDPLSAPADVAAIPPDAAVTNTGLASKILQAGTGTDHPSAFSVVRVHYSGWTTDGKLFDSSVSRGRPAEFPLNGVIAGWRQGLKLMVEGEKRRFWIPEELAYKGMSGPQGMLVFEVELLKIVTP